MGLDMIWFPFIKKNPIVAAVPSMLFFVQFFTVHVYGYTEPKLETIHLQSLYVAHLFYIYLQSQLKG